MRWLRHVKAAQKDRLRSVRREMSHVKGFWT